MIMKSNKPLLSLIAGYISSLVGYLIWYYKIWHYSQYQKNITHAANMDIVAFVFGITALYLFLYYLILSIRTFQTPWNSFFLVSITTLLIIFLIPSVYYARYQFTRAEEKSLKEREAKLNNAIAENDAAKNYTAELQVKLGSEHKNNDKLRKQLNKTISKTKSLEEDRIKEDVVVGLKANEDYSKIKINSEVGSYDSDTKNQGIIFKVQIIASSTRLETNSPQFNGLKNVWEYKDSGLYKYTVGNQKDLKSAYWLQSELRDKGFVGAFVVAFKNGKRIGLREAKKLLN
jgi:F0F1-type ATP synthase membrane subunit b/b'